ncbi:NAD(P)H-binding protein [Deinococcus sp.]|uniref:NAD(P)H-binding protein n=1 Tax=Deinococcus sp. TaxID=47478 RepID=UPI0025FB0862|nr:NAD(P)H-binding protein [Deinococcus sp.]
MIIVTGATGQLGHAVVLALLKLVPASEIGVSVRDPRKASDLEALGVRVRQGDFADPASLQHAFGGATQVLMVSSNAWAYGGDPLAQHQAAIEAAHAAGVRRVVYTSQIAASPTSAFAPAVDHAATEELLRQSGLAWTSLRNGFYASSGLMSMGNSLDTGLLEAPADGKVAWAAHADLAEAAAILMANPGRYEGPTPPLTGSQALDLADLAAIATELGRPVQRIVFPDEQLGAKLEARGMLASAARFMLGNAIASRNGEFGPVDPALEQLIGHPPTTMRDLIAAKLGR